MAVIAVITCIVLQLICAAVNYFYAYSIEGTVSDGAAWTVINVALDFLGQISIFSGYGIVCYLVFLYGQGEGGEWLIALASGYFLVYFLIFFIGDITFALASSVLTAIVLAAVYLIWTKSCHAISLIVFGSMLIPYVGATAIYVSSGVVTSETLKENYAYCFLNLGLDFLVIIVAARISNYFRKRALAKEGSVDISIGERILPHGNPVLKSFLVICIGYTAVSLIATVIDTVSLLTEYGAPINASEWYTLLSPYFFSLIYLALGYAVMLLIATRLERAYMEEAGE